MTPVWFAIPKIRTLSFCLAVTTQLALNAPRLCKSARYAELRSKTLLKYSKRDIIYSLYLLDSFFLHNILLQLIRQNFIINRSFQIYLSVRFSLKWICMWQSKNSPLPNYISLLLIWVLCNNLSLSDSPNNLCERSLHCPLQNPDKLSQKHNYDGSRRV